MKPEEIDQVLAETLEDHRFTRSERRSLRERVEREGLDDDGLAFWRHRAFVLARGALTGGDPAAVVDWLEGAVKALVPTPGPSRRVAEVHVSPGDACLRRIVQLLLAAKSSVDICVFTITDDRLSGPILEAHRRGVKVRIASDDDKAFDAGSDIRRLADAGIEVRVDESEHHMHHKFAVFDGHVAVTGSYNWTRSAADYNRENIAVTDDPVLVAGYRRIFDQLWADFAP